MMVWPKSCQVRCVRQKFHGVVAKGFVAEKISSANFCFEKGGSCGTEVFRSMSQGKV
jgi:hypothetical protein